MIIIMNPKFMA